MNDLRFFFITIWYLAQLPLLPLPFDLSFEPLATMERKSLDIKGIALAGFDCKSFLYVDNILLNLEQYSTCLPNFINVVQYFRKCSDYKLNRITSCFLHLGAHISIQLCKEMSFEISIDYIKYFGLYMF